MASFQKLCGFEVHLFSLHSDAHMMMLERTLVLPNSGINKKERLLASEGLDSALGLSLNHVSQACTR